jgi:hypothetical protein
LDLAWEIVTRIDLRVFFAANFRQLGIEQRYGREARMIVLLCILPNATLQAPPIAVARNEAEAIGGRLQALVRQGPHVPCA